jgi:hypothetical protein
MAAASSCLSVWTGEDDHIAIRVLDPDLPVLRSWIDVRLFDDPSAQTSDPVDGSIEVIDFEPEEDAMAVGCPVGAHQIRVLLVIPAVQLENKGLSTHDSVIDLTVGMVRIPPIHLRSQQGLIPGAAGPHVPHRNQCLRPDHRSSTSLH